MAADAVPAVLPSQIWSTGSLCLHGGWLCWRGCQTDDEKAQAEILILQKVVTDRDAYVAGNQEIVTKRIKALLSSGM